MMKYFVAVIDGFMECVKFLLDYLAAFVVGNGVAFLSGIIIALAVYSTFGPVEVPENLEHLGETNMFWSIFVHFIMLPLLFFRTGRRMVDAI